MPVSFSVDEEFRLFRVRFSGTIVLADILELATRVLSAQSPTLDTLVDISQATDTALTGEDSLDVVNHIPRSSKLVVVVTGEDWETRARTWMADSAGSAPPGRRAVFVTEPEALAWLEERRRSG